MAICVIIRNSNPVAKMIGYASRWNRNGNLELENQCFSHGQDKPWYLRRGKKKEQLSMAAMRKFWRD